MIQLTKESENNVMIILDNFNNTYHPYFILKFEHISSEDIKTICLENLSEYRKYLIFRLDENDIKLKTGNHYLKYYNVLEETTELTEANLIDTELVNVTYKNNENMND